MRKPRTPEQKQKDALAARERRARRKVEGTMKKIRSFAKGQVRAMKKAGKTSAKKTSKPARQRHDGAQICISMVPRIYGPFEKYRNKKGFKISRSKLIEAAIEAYLGKRGVKFAEAS